MGPRRSGGMAFTMHSFVLIMHVLFASLWFGGAVFQVLVVGSAMRRAGPAAIGFMQAVAKNGGFAPYVAISGVVTVVAGGFLYYDSKIGQDAWTGSNLWLSIGAILGVAALLEGIFGLRPLNNKWVAALSGIKVTPTPEQGKQIADLGMRIGKMTLRSMVLIALAMILMLLWRVGFTLQ